jgi:hypothetical protein
MGQDPEPIAYTALQPGTPMLSTSGTPFGTVDTVLEIPEHDLFDGIIVATETGRRFVDADQVVEVTTAYVRCSISDQQARDLPEHSASPTYRADATRHAGGGLGNMIGRLFGRGSWKRDR